MQIYIKIANNQIACRKMCNNYPIIRLSTIAHFTCRKIFIKNISLKQTCKQLYIRILKIRNKNLDKNSMRKSVEYFCS